MKQPRLLATLVLAALAPAAHAQHSHIPPLRVPPAFPAAKPASAIPTLPPAVVKRQALDNAIARNDKPAVVALLRVSPDLINQAAPYNYSPLQTALQSSHPDMAELLIAHGADINAADPFGRTPLHNAVQNYGSESLAMLDVLLAHHANVNAFDNDGFMPLHSAVKAGNLPAVQRFLDYGMNVNTQNVDGDSPLHLAAAAGNLAVGAFLISSGARVNARSRAGDTPLHAAMHAAEYNNTDNTGAATGADATKAAMELLLLEHGAHINARDSFGVTPLLSSLLNKDKIAHAVLLQYHPAMDTQTAFLEAVVQNNVPALRRLLQTNPVLASARVVSGTSPFHIAALWNAQQSAALLIAHGANINIRDAQGQTPLHYAARIQDGTPMTAWLLAHHADPNAADAQGSTPLHVAALRGARSAAATLLAHHAAVSPRNHSKETPLGLTLPFSNNENLAAIQLPITALLLRAGADPNIRTFGGSETPLLRAVQMNDTPLVRLLLDSGANPSTTADFQHNTPLMVAADRPDTAITALLLAHGADPAATNTAGDTALAMATRANRPDIIALLRAAPAR